VEKLWKSCGKAVEKLWKSCGKAVEKLWKSCGKAVEKLWIRECEMRPLPPRSHLNVSSKSGHTQKRSGGFSRTVQLTLLELLNLLP
jgi:hypothetical protein